jgi:superfamily II DNA or RNA helicase
MDELIRRYNKYIFDKTNDLIKSGKDIDEFDNFDLAKIFEYYSCIKLTQEYKQIFYEYRDIDPEFKELNNMSKNDTGVDASNLKDTIVQCKLRKDTLTWKECSTFFGSNVITDDDNKLQIKWNKMIITRNAECTLSHNLKNKITIFNDKTYTRKDILEYCSNLLENPPPKQKEIIEKVEIRDYQKECIELIKNSTENVIISLPTGTGKNFIIVQALNKKFKYLILVPRIILMEQIKHEIIKYKPTFKNLIQMIGDGNTNFDEDKKITICVYNSVNIVEEYVDTFDNIFIDEAHHIMKPDIYKTEEEMDIDSDCSSEDEYEDEDESDYNDSEYSESEDESEQEDEDNESADNKNYINTIKSFSKYNNNIYLSATIDEHDKFKYYSKDIRDMIDNKYLCDYIIKIPIFTDDPTNKNICEYLIKNYRNIIIYCNSQKEGNLINRMMNSIQKKSSEYIDCNTPKSKRNKILENYKSGELAFLVNVKILVEGFDAPITKGVCFIHLPSSKTTLIQIIGRALRLHKDKVIANIILPFSDNKDEDSINNFLKVMAQNDSRIKKSYMKKKLGGYVDFVRGEELDDGYMENQIELKYELIFDKMGTMKNTEEIWDKLLEEVKKFIDENNKRPSNHHKDIKIKQLGRWINNQQQNYRKKQKIMINEDIQKKWTEFIEDDKYKIYFLSNEDYWENKLKEIKSYIDINNKRPYNNDKDNKIKQLAQWIGTQQKNYRKKQRIMINEYICKKWKEFIEDKKYKKYFLSNEQEWGNNLKELKSYIDENNKRPNSNDKNIIIKQLGVWIGTQQRNYPTKQYIMSNEYIRKKWGEFIEDEKYKKYFLTNEELWENKLKEVKLYINENNKRPSESNKDNKIKQLAKWIGHQQNNYKKNKGIMSNEYIRKKWKNFIEDDKYKIYFNTIITNEQPSPESDDTDSEEEIEPIKKPVKKTVKNLVNKTLTKKIKK